MNVYRSSPPLPGIYLPFFLLPSAHVPPLPDSEDSSGIEGIGSDDESGHAEAGEAAGEDESGGHSPSPSDGTRVDHPKGTRTTARKRRGASQSGVDRYVLAYVAIEYFSEFHRIALLKLLCFSFLSPAGKMPWTSASGDDARVGSTVPSTPVDPSKGTKTAPAGSSKGGGAGAGGSRALVVGVLPKLSMPKKLSMKRAPA